MRSCAIIVRVNFEERDDSVYQEGLQKFESPMIKMGDFPSSVGVKFSVPTFIDLMNTLMANIEGPTIIQ